jgi:hypothetical protein
MTYGTPRAGDQAQLEFEFWPVERERALRLADDTMRAVALALQSDPKFRPTENTGRMLAEQRAKLAAQLEELFR